MPTSASWRLWPRRWTSRCSSAPSTSPPRRSAAARTWKPWPGASAIWPPTRPCGRCASTRGGPFRRRASSRPTPPTTASRTSTCAPSWAPAPAVSAACSTATDRWCARCSTSRATSCATTLPPGRRRGRRWFATGPARSGARTPPTPIPIASAPTCATRSCRRPRNGTARCPRC